ncbi:GerAB/ArcD/ProY family transporter [Anaerosalibacter bizertensis]|uniref:GerAB/ArcD/ProY family transporter n=1 Tax=Anaerosalibacter bizertensis TaxID=932217 RepID=UPI003519B99A
MEQHSRLSNGQLKALIITANIGVGILSLPSSIADIMNNAGWIAIVLGGLATLPFVYIMNKLAEMYRGRIFYEYGKEVVGNILFKIFNVVYLTYFLVFLAFVVRIFGEVIEAYLLQNTPIEVIMFTMLLATSYIGRSDIESLSRMAFLILPIIALITIFFVILSLPTLDFTNVLPAFRFNIKDVPKGVVTVFFSYMGFEIILVALAYTKDSRSALKYSIRGILYTTIIYLVTFFITLSQFGIHELKKQIWPSISVMREIDLPGFFIENLDGIMMANWVLVVFATMGPLMYAGGVVLSSLFNTKKHNFFVIPLIPIVMIIALIPESLTQVYSTMDMIVRYLAIFTIIIAPTILFIVSLLKRRKKV